MASYREAIGRDPAFALAYLKLGEALSRLGQLAEAVQVLDRAVELQPAQAGPKLQLADALMRSGSLDAARRQYERACDLEPGNSAAANNLGTVCQELGDHAAAAAAYGRALSGFARLCRVTFQSGCLVQQAARLSRGRRPLWPRARCDQSWPKPRPRWLSRCTSKVAATRPGVGSRTRPGGFPAAWCCNCAARTVSTCVHSNEAIDEYRQSVSAQLADISTSFANKPKLSIGALQELADSGCFPPVDWAYQGRDDRSLKSHFADLLATAVVRHSADSPGRTAGLPRLAFLVTAGSEGVFLRGMAGVVARLDANRFQVAVVCPPAAVDRCRREIGNSAVSFLPLPQALPAAVAAIRAACFDLVYFWEIGTSGLNYFLPFFRLAPVQCTSWGWPITSGIPQVDYFISSSQIEPPNGAEHYRESLVLLGELPNFYECPAAVVPADRAEFGWDMRQHVYFCGQSPRKIHPDFDELIGEILRQDPRGVVALVAATLAPVTAALQARISRRLPDMAHRVQWLPRQSGEGYRRLAAAADVVLDTVHYAGGANSTYDVLAAGTPLVTLAGDYHRGRYAAAVCRMLGLEDCVATSPAAYVAIATRLANDGQRQCDVRSRIRERSPAHIWQCVRGRGARGFFHAGLPELTPHADRLCRHCPLGLHDRQRLWDAAGRLAIGPVLPGRRTDAAGP